MSVDKPLDYGAWTRQNFPKLSASEQSLLSDKLLEIEKSVVNSPDPQATLEAWGGAISATRRSIAALSPPAGH